MSVYFFVFFFFFQAEDGIRDAQESRGLGDVYKRQELITDMIRKIRQKTNRKTTVSGRKRHLSVRVPGTCLLYTSDAADDLLCVDLGGRRIIKKKKNNKESQDGLTYTDNTYCKLTHNINSKHY